MLGTSPLRASSCNAKHRLLPHESAAERVMVAHICSPFMLKIQLCNISSASQLPGNPEKDPAKVETAVNSHVGTETQCSDPKALMVSAAFISEVNPPLFVENLEKLLNLGYGNLVYLNSNVWQKPECLSV